MAQTKMDTVIHEIVRRINNDSHQIKLLDQRMQTLERRMETMENTNVSKTKKIKEEINTLQSSIKELRDTVSSLKKENEGLNRQINKFATKKDIMTLEQMFNLLSPGSKKES